MNARQTVDRTAGGIFIAFGILFFVFATSNIYDVALDVLLIIVGLVIFSHGARRSNLSKRD